MTSHTFLSRRIVCSLGIFMTIPFLRQAVGLNGFDAAKISSGAYA